MTDDSAYVGGGPASDARPDDSLRLDARAVLSSASASGERALFLRHLDAHPDAMWRTGPPDHFTASAVVFDHPRRQVLLVLHKKAGRWLQPGGHFEPVDGTVEAAALREATEESGIEGLRAIPGAIYLHHHGLPPQFGRCSSHLDLRIAAVAPAGAVPAASEESDDVRWWPVGALPADTDPDLANCIRVLEAQIRASSDGQAARH